VAAPPEVDAGNLRVTDSSKVRVTACIHAVGLAHEASIGAGAYVLWG
jgi:hypothetical protein